jgi:cell wall-associated NlpC family hydrolase
MIPRSFWLDLFDAVKKQPGIRCAESASYAADTPRMPTSFTPSGFRPFALALALAASASCATGAVEPLAFPGARPMRRDVRLAPPLNVPAILDTARSLEGTPYQFGGDRPASGFDCSGLVRFVFGEHRIDVPRTTDAQFGAGRSVDDVQVRAGDLVFFSTTGPGPTHVGIAIDGATMVHAPGTGAHVRVERIDTPYWQSRRIGNRRVLEP